MGILVLALAMLGTASAAAQDDEASGETTEQGGAAELGAPAPEPERDPSTPDAANGPALLLDSPDAPVTAFRLPEPRPVVRADTSGERRGALALTIGGGVLTGGGGVVLLLGGLFSWDALEPEAPAMVLAGSVAVAIGLPLLFSGIYWLIEQTEARHASRRASAPWVIRF